MCFSVRAMKNLDDQLCFAVRQKIPFPGISGMSLEEIERELLGVIPAQGVLLPLNPSGKWDVLDFFDDESGQDLAREFGSDLASYKQIRIARFHVARYLVGQNIAERIAV